MSQEMNSDCPQLVEATKETQPKELKVHVLDIAHPGEVLGAEEARGARCKYIENFFHHTDASCDTLYI